MGHDTNPRAALAAPTGNYGERMALHSFPKMSGLLCSSNHSQKIETTPQRLLSEAEADPQRYPHLTAICQQLY